MPQITPAHPHDCDKCVILGVFQDGRTGPNDVYFCPPEQSLVRRFGPMPEAYASFPRDIARSVSEHISGDNWVVPVAMLDVYVTQHKGELPR